MPVYMTFGNHDIGNSGIMSIFKNLFKNQESKNKKTQDLMLNQINYANYADNPVVSNSSGKSLRLWNFDNAFYEIKKKRA